mgnify:CR=1 FL=1
MDYTDGRGEVKQELTGFTNRFHEGLARCAGTIQVQRTQRELCYSVEVDEYTYVERVTG